MPIPFSDLGDSAARHCCDSQGLRTKAQSLESTVSARRAGAVAAAPPCCGKGRYNTGPPAPSAERIPGSPSPHLQATRKGQATV